MAMTMRLDEMEVNYCRKGVVIYGRLRFVADLLFFGLVFGKRALSRLSGTEEKCPKCDGTGIRK